MHCCQHFIHAAHALQGGARGSGVKASGTSASAQNLLERCPLQKEETEVQGQRPGGGPGGESPVNSNGF